MRKTTLFLLVFLIIKTSLIAQQYYVWAKTGLSLRDQPSFNSKKIDLLPYGTKLDDITYIEEYETDSILIFSNPNNLKDKFYLFGNWQAINYKGKSGFVFDAYVSSMPPIMGLKDLDNYISKNYRKLDSLEIDIRQSSIVTYDKGLLTKQLIQEGGGKSYYYFVNRTFNDGFLLFKYFEEIPEKLEVTNESTIECFFSKNELRISFHEGADSYISISYIDGILVLMSGGNC